MPTHSTTLTCDVLVVGAGPAGLATAIEAARHGADVLLAERRAGLSPHPRATGVSTRTMEILRTWAVDAAVLAAAMDVEPMMAFTSTLGTPPHRVQPLGYPTAAEAAAVSPAIPVCCPQDALEPILLAELLRLGGRVRFGAPFTGLAHVGDGVRARLGDTSVAARYVVGADGAHSAVRAALGIGVEAVGHAGEFLSVVFRADLPAAYALYAIDPAAVREVVLPVGDGRFVYARQLRPGAAVGDWSRAQLVRAIRRVAGVPGLAVDVLTVGGFAMTGELARTYRAGPGFVVGDAAHRMTPMGGVGMNTAIHSGHNLGWKLGWVATNRADDALLDTYAAERAPVGRENVLRSLGRGGAGGLLHDLGTTYGTAAPATVADLAVPRAGARVPHRWLRPGVSTLDLATFSLVTGPSAGAWRAAAAGLTVVPGGLAGDERGAALVRPDGYVHAMLLGVAPAAELSCALRGLLGATHSARRAS
jgi:putative polyketide hydroxylase